MNIYEKYKEHIEFAHKAVRAEGYEVLCSEIVGSTYIADNENSDLDVLVLVKKWESVDCMCFDGWAYGGSVGEGNESKWGSWKKSYNGKEVNLLVTDCQEYYYKWLVAAEVCRYINKMQDQNYSRHGYDAVHEHSLRIGIHNIIMDDNDADMEVK